MAELLMPKLSDTMEEGTILQWMKGEGEEVAQGEPLVEIETDKANMVVEAPEGGALHIVAPEGETLPVGAPIAAIGGGGAAAAEPKQDDGAEAPAAEAGEPHEQEEPEEREEGTNIPVSDDGTGDEIGMEVGVGETYPEAEREDDRPDAGREGPPPARRPRSEDGDRDAGGQGEAPAAAPARRPAEAPARRREDGAGGGERVKASPLARNLAKDLGVDLSAVRATGPGGRIVRADVEAAAREPRPAEGEAEERPAPARPAPAAGAPARGDGAAAGERTPLTRLQRTIARRLAESWRAPHFFLQRDVDATDLLALRRALVDAAPEGEEPTVNDLVVRAVAIAASEHPEWLRQYAEDDLVQPGAVNVGIAVAAERGLLVPVVRDAADKSVGRIARETRDLIARTRDGSVGANELEGSTISVSNLGMFGVDRFTAVVNPPESAILAVGRAAPRPVARDGEVVVRDVMTLTLSVDHRALQGADGARLLGRIAELLERPHALLL
jgi:pyruvate dehydrogenase E2 component (dihydrolipoyllysine-residue acetyltransferase)